VHCIMYGGVLHRCLVTGSFLYFQREEDEEWK